MDQLNSFELRVDGDKEGVVIGAKDPRSLLGAFAGKIQVAEDFDEIPAEFGEYL